MEVILKDLIAVIGPCIGKNNYEVRNDFFKKFIKKKNLIKNFLIPKNNKIYFSLNDYIKENF